MFSFLAIVELQSFGVKKRKIIQYISQQMHSAKYNKMQIIRQFMTSINFYMFRHRRVILRESRKWQSCCP